MSDIKIPGSQNIPRVVNTQSDSEPGEASSAKKTTSPDPAQQSQESSQAENIAKARLAENQSVIAQYNPKETNVKDKVPNKP